MSRFVGVAESVDCGEHLAPPRDFLQPLFDTLQPLATHQSKRWRTIMLDKKKNFNIGAYLMDLTNIPGALSHELLSNLMPFYCCWLPDAEEESKPCAASVALASMLYSTRLLSLGTKPTHEWQN